MIQKVSQADQKLQLQLRNAAATSACAGHFEEMLRSQAAKSGSLQFSKHAAQRISQRQIDVSESLLGDLNRAVDKAREKGAKDVVVISSRGAFLVNVPNNMVVTTMTDHEMKEHIFTKIDGAVLI